VSVAADGGVVVKVVGELDLATVPDVQHRLSELPLDAERQVVFDVEGVTFLSAAGVRAVLDAKERVGARGGTFVLRAPSRLVARVLRAAGVEDLLPVEPAPGDGVSGDGVSGDGVSQH
jgi:anti-anti-sigma factor